MAQLNLQPTPIGILNDLIEVTSYSENVNNSNEISGNCNYNSNSRSKNNGNNDFAVKSAKETNLLMIKAEKLSANSIIKCIKKVKSSCFSVSSSRKVAALLSQNRNRVKIFELEVDDGEGEGEDQEEEEPPEVEGEDERPEKKTLDFHQQGGFQVQKSSAVTSYFTAPPPLAKETTQSKQFLKHSSASSSCSLAPSVSSSTCATFGSSGTIILESANASLNAGRGGKR